MVKLTKITEQYGSNNYIAYEDENKQRYLANRIDSYGILQTGSMFRNTRKLFDLSSFNIESFLSIKSVYAFSGSTTADELKFKIYQKKISGELDLIAYQKFTNSDMPFQFPEGAIISPNQIIEVEPRYDVDNIVIYVKPIDILFSLNAT